MLASSAIPPAGSYPGDSLLNAALKSSAVNTARRKTKLVLCDQVIVSGANFVIGLLLARSLGPAAYGQFVLTFNIVMFAYGINIALINSPLLVLGVVTDHTGREYFRAVIAGQVVYCVMAAALLLCLAPVFDRFAPHWGVGDLLWLLMFAMVGFLSLEFCRRYLFVRDRPGAALSVDLLNNGLKFSLLAGIAWWLGLTGADAYWVMGTGSFAGILLAVSLRTDNSRWRPPDRQSMRNAIRAHWHLGKWLVAESVAALCGSQSVLYIAGNTISLSAVGAISAAMNIVGVCNVLFLALENFVPTRAAKTYAERDANALTRYLRRVSLLGGAATLLLVGIAAAGSEFWLALVYGSAYRGNGALILWSGLFYLLSFAQRPFAIGLRVLGHTKGIFLATLGGAVIALTISYPAVRFVGLDGAMLAMCAVQAAMVAILGLYFRRALRLRHEPGGAQGLISG